MDDCKVRCHVWAHGSYWQSFGQCPKCAVDTKLNDIVKLCGWSAVNKALQEMKTSKK